MNLEELSDHIQFFARRACRRFGCLADCDNRHNSFCFRNIKEFAEFIRFTNSHDQSGKSEVFCLEDQVFILQTKVIASPSVSKFIVSCAILLETGAVMYEGCYDQRSILRFTRISRTRKAGCTAMAIEPKELTEDCSSALERLMTVLWIPAGIPT